MIQPKRILAALLCLLLGWAWPALPEESAPHVAIRTVMTRNPSLCLSVGEEFFDWVELVNLSGEALDLKDWVFTDQPDMKNAYLFGHVTLPPGGALVVYCADRPAGYDGDALFTGFSLSSAGETLILSDPSESHVRQLEVPAMAAGEVYERAADGSYSVVSFEDSIAASLYGTALDAEYRADALIITELMPANGSTLRDVDGDTSDWIEVYNGTGEEVSLSGWSLSDDDADRRKWCFPEMSLGAGGYLIVFASGKDRSETSEELHTNFKLSRQGETVRLYAPDGSVSSWMRYDKAQKDRSVARQADGSVRASQDPTPGYPNDAKRTAVAVYTQPQALSHNAQGVYINEIVARGTGDDWLELVNEGAERMDLSGFGLSDDPLHPRAWYFPQGAFLDPGKYLMVALTGKDGVSEDHGTWYSADIGLAAGETVVLSYPDGTVLDQVELAEQYWSVSYGRAAGQACYRYFPKPTPGGSNDSASYAARAGRVVFSVRGGLMSGDVVTLSLSAQTGATIYYTLDGTTPTAASEVYSSPISISQNTVVKAICALDDLIPSETEAQTYLFGASHSLRVVCVSGARDQLNGSQGMLNTGVRGNGADVFVEMYEPDGEQILGQDCLMLLAGHGSRTDMKQKGFSLRAKGRYGETVFDAALFSDRPYTEYKSIFMRASGQDAQRTHLLDSVLTSLAGDTSLLYQETELTVLYVNGEYWGEYNLRERISTECICQFEGWNDPDDVILLEGSGGSLHAVQGSVSGYRSLMSGVRERDFTDDATVELLRQYVDIENYLDYVAFQIYSSNQDLNNVRCYCDPKEDGRWKWILFDLDLSFQVDANSVSRWLTQGGVGSVTSQDNTLFIQLMKNAKVRDWFLRHMGKLLATTLSAENVKACFTEQGKAIYEEMQRTCERWGWSF